MSKDEVSIEQRQRTYNEAEAVAVAAAERYIEARAGGRMTVRVVREMDQAELELRRAKRQLEDTKKRSLRQFDAMLRSLAVVYGGLFHE